jgi:glycerophosphoryl diester phosphodiesterase
MTNTVNDILNEIYSKGYTLIFGHRGAKAYAPMNTIPSFELAAQQGADGVELDVWLSKDGYPVIIHDDTVDGTTDGHGNVQEKTLAEIKTLDASSYFDAKFVGTRIPTLDEVFEAVGKKLIINVEIKSNAARREGIEQVVKDCILRHNMQRRVIVSSFDARVLKTFREIMPDVPIGYLYAPDYTFFPEIMNTLPHEACHPHHSMLTAEYVHMLKGYRINTWTVNEPERVKELLALGIDCIISDKPDMAIEARHASHR